jgi:hypothetical protein
VLKGDYPIFGQHNFLNLTITEDLLLEGRQVPTPTTPFESTSDPNSNDFFGDPDQFFLSNNLVVSADWVHGDGAFKPADWRMKVTQIFNVNHLVVDELGIVNPNVQRGTARMRADYALEEWFFETKLADLSPDYDFLSVRAGSQPFVSDFRGFVFADVNRMVRLFGNRDANRDQFNVIWVDQTEKDTNSFLNTFGDRHQNTVILNYYHQDFIWPGYTAQLSYLYNRDGPSFKFDQNDFLVRPDPVGDPRQPDRTISGFARDRGREDAHEAGVDPDAVLLTGSMDPPDGFARELVWPCSKELDLAAERVLKRYPEVVTSLAMTGRAAEAMVTAPVPPGDTLLQARLDDVTTVRLRAREVIGKRLVPTTAEKTACPTDRSAPGDEVDDVEGGEQRRSQSGRLYPDRRDERQQNRSLERHGR